MCEKMQEIGKSLVPGEYANQQDRSQELLSKLREDEEELGRNEDLIKKVEKNVEDLKSGI